MKLVTYKVGKAVSYGAVVGDGVVDLGKRLGKKYPTLRAALKAGKLAELKATAAKAKKTDVALKKITFLPVIPDAKKIICVGLNYKDHQAETGNKETPHPTLFLRIQASQVGHEQPLIKPKESEKLDWEGELAVIIGRKGRRIAREKAMSHVAGYSCYHDGSVRDFQRHTSQFTPGKNFVGTGGFGPWLVTADEIKDISKQTLTTRVNGVVKQQAGIDLLIFDIPALIAYISTFTTLEGGDVIVTGTPGGVGAARNPPEFLKPGDVTEIDISGVGVLRNTVKEG
ncbi:MAG: fumarylacetoacetate hydrolase family protein [Alphaproteobacteria bacterium]|nr:fumarylacetoacetate hydrolase family protein [Alphaproteobacteria bacterium]